MPDSHAPRPGLSDAKRALLEKRLKGRLRPVSPVIPVRDDTTPARLSFGQERLFFLHQLHPQQAAYNMTGHRRLHGRLDITALTRSFNVIVAQQDSLRTVIRMQEDQPCLLIVPFTPVDIPFIDLRDTPDADRVLYQHALHLTRQPFDLTKEPLFRTLLLQTGDDEHVFLFVLHHIIADEWSLEVFWRMMAAQYSHPAATSPAPLPIQYADYAAWQRHRWEQHELADQHAYWQQQLTPPLPVLDLPVDYPRPPRQSMNGAWQALPLPPALATDLRALGQATQATPYMTVLAAFFVWLFRYTGQSDLVAGSPMTTRNRPEVNDLIGFFLNTVVLRMSLSPSDSFRTVLQKMRTVVLEAVENQEVPFEKLVEKLQPVRDLSHNPLFQVMLVYQQEAPQDTLAPGITLQPYTVDLGASKFDLTLFVTEAGGGFSVALEYRTDLFAEDTITRMLAHWHTLLEGLLNHPDQPIASLPMLTPDEQHQLLHASNDTAAPYPDTTCIHHLFEHHARHTPGAMAVYYRDSHLTFEVLNRHADALAHRLQKRGIGPNRVVGLCAERSSEMVIGMLGILKAGGAFLPLDPTYPEARLTWMMQDAGISHLLTQPHLVDGLPPTKAETILLDASAPLPETLPPPTPAAGPDDLAYLIYTSGSTGQPKGVRITHRNIVHSTWARLLYYPPGDPAQPVPHTFLLLSSFSFDSAMAGLFWMLCGGGTLVLPAQGQEKDLHALLDLIVRHRVTHTLCVPSLYQALLSYGTADQLASLRGVIVAGEACPPSLPSQHYRLAPDAILYNEYGPTEATVWCTAYAIPAAFRGEQVPIGTPIANATVYVLDASRQPVPVGVPGELYVGGAGIAQGYHNQPDQTADRFIPDPFARTKKGPLYKTGDRVCYSADGTLVFLGRIDHQVKLRGHRIELTEIAAMLETHPAVREAVVTTGTLASSPAALARALQTLPDAQAKALLDSLKEQSSSRDHQS